MKKVLGYTVVGLLVLGLVAGVAYILLNPTGAQAERNGTTSGQGQGQGSNGTGQGRGRAGGVESFDQVTNEIGQKEELSAEEIEGILFMREEEKLARDVYLTLYEQWEVPIFQNIANSEQTHMDAIGTLIDRYGLDDPAAGREVGEFTDPTLRSLYDDLVTAGSQSLADALRVGANIEEIDILDLERYIAQTDARDIQRVYESLTKGSRNHLRAFVTTLERETGETYEPQYLSSDAYDNIVSTAAESGGNGRGGSRGGGGGGSRSAVNDTSVSTEPGMQGGRGGRNSQGSGGN